MLNANKSWTSREEMDVNVIEICFINVGEGWDSVARWASLGERGCEI